MADTGVLGATFFVATKGNDAWSGRLPEPNAEGTDGPFASLARARNAVRELKEKDGLKEPVTVMLRGGRYFLPQTLVLRDSDSGTRDCPVTYTAYPGEKPILSGGTRLTDWQPCKGKILQCELPEAKGGKWKFRQLFFDGQRQIRARWPKFDPANPIYGGWALIEGPGEKASTTAFKYKPGTFRYHWAEPTEVEVSIFPGPGWNMRTVAIKNIDEGTRIVTLASDEWNTDVFPWYLPFTLEPETRFCVENALEELDQPGEWCFDSEDGILYFWPPEKSIEDCDTVIPVLDCLVDIQGASWLRISGFTFTETLDGDNLHPQGVQGMGAMGLRAGPRDVGNALRLRRAEHCAIEDNHFRDVGGNAVYLEDYNARNVIRCNEISGAGANGVCLAGSKLRHPIFNEVTDNYIHHCGVLNKYVAGVTCGFSDGNRICHNRIEYLPHHAINLANNPIGRNILEYNEIRWVCQEIADSAAINCWMELPPREGERCGHIIRYNLISDVYGCEVRNGKVGPSEVFPTSGIYLDNYASNCLVHGNIIVRCTHAGVLVHGGKNNIIENNIIVDCQQNVRLQDVVCTLEYWNSMAGFMTGIRIERNIGYQTRRGALVFHLDAWTDRVVARSDENLFFQKGNGKYAIEHVCNLEKAVRIPANELPEEERIDTLVKWQALGFDTNSRFEDPMFVDPEHDNYGLRPESPAFKLGFEPIDVMKIGLRKKTK